jgi:hypothetical protein
MLHDTGSKVNIFMANEGHFTLVSEVSESESMQKSIHAQVDASQTCQISNSVWWASQFAKSIGRLRPSYASAEYLTLLWLLLCVSLIVSLIRGP